jgi:hypothetical protein
MTCTHAEELLDLYAAGECDPVTAAAIEQHHAGCPACAAAEREARRVQALLDLHNQAPAGLARLKKRIDQEDRFLRQPRRVPPFASLVAAAAALVLLTFGLTGGGPQQPETIAADVLAGPGAVRTMKSNIGMAEMAQHAPADARFANAIPLGSEETLTVVLDRRGKTAEEYRHYLRERQRAGALPIPPTLDLSLELHNPGPAEKTLHLEDERASLSLDLQGAGVLRLGVPGEGVTPFPPNTIRLEPGRSQPLPIRMIEGNRRQVQYLYWTEAGEYTLTVRLRVPASDHAPSGPQPIVPVKDLDCVTYVSRPVRIKVLEKR